MRRQFSLESESNMDYVTGKIAKIFDMGEGTRVEADFIDILGKDEGC